MSIKDMSFLQRFNHAQVELKAPKGQFNSFGKYKYRSAEDILEAVKPTNLKYYLHLQIQDEMKMIGDRIYLVATCTLSDVLGKSDPIVVTGYAREPLNKKGMDEAQITGATSSYARKYALNGLYLIDDTKDADTNEFQHQQNNAPAQARKPQLINNNQVNEINELIKEIAILVDEGTEKEDTDKLTRWVVGKFPDISNVSEIPSANFNDVMNLLNNTKAKYQPKGQQGTLMEGNTTTARQGD